MNRLTIKTKLYLLIVLFLACAIAGHLLLLGRLSSAASADEEFTASRLTLQDRARLIQLSLKKQVEAWNNLLLRGGNEQERAKYWTEFSTRESEVDSQVADLSRDVSDPAIHAQLATFREDHSRLGEQYREAIKRAPTRCGWDPRPPDSLVKGKDGPVTDGVDAIVLVLTQQTKDLQNSQQSEMSNKNRVVALSGLGMLFLAAILGWYVAHSLTQNFGALLGQAHNWDSGNADL
ncbi:MAG TPA: hypothetical protein VIW67_25200, partial [Terriglobales bacterium]